MKLTAEQIKDALKRCATPTDEGCKNCPLGERGLCNDELCSAALAHIAQLEAELAELREALKKAKYNQVDCSIAEHQGDGKCLGYSRAEYDDEPCEQCINCPKCSAYEPDEAKGG